MKAAGVLITACLVTMAAAIGYGLLFAEFWAEGAVLMDLTWGVISVIDVYTGGALFAGWIAYRERSIPRVALWIVAIVILGNLATSIYALLAWRDARGDWERFWGTRSSRRVKPEYA